MLAQRENLCNQGCIPMRSLLCCLVSRHQDKQTLFTAFECLAQGDNLHILLDLFDTRDPSKFHTYCSCTQHIWWLVQVLLRLLKAKAAAADYLAVMVGMDLSLHSLEVVNRLATSAELPQEFVQDYIAGCIASCERAQVR